MALVALSFFAGSELDTRPARNIRDTFETLATWFKVPRIAPKNQGYFIRGEANYRSDEDLKTGCVMVLDGDSSWTIQRHVSHPLKPTNFL